MTTGRINQVACCCCRRCVILHSSHLGVVARRPRTESGRASQQWQQQHCCRRRPRRPAQPAPTRAPALALCRLGVGGRGRSWPWGRQRWQQQPEGRRRLHRRPLSPSRRSPGSGQPSFWSVFNVAWLGGLPPTGLKTHTICRGVSWTEDAGGPGQGVSSGGSSSQRRHGRRRLHRRHLGPSQRSLRPGPPSFWSVLSTRADGGAPGSAR